MHVHLCLALWLFSPRLSSVLYFVPPFSFQPFLMFTSALNERSRSNPLCDFRLGTVVTSDHETPLTHNVIGVQTCLSEENKNVRVEQTHDRSGQLDKHNVAVPDARVVHHEIKMLNIDNELIRERIEEDMDFKIPGLPHSIVKQLLSANVRELIQKIENHPHRHALQRNLQQSQSFNPFSQETKQMIHEVGNIELCESLDTEPKTQCKVCLSYWDIGIVYCTCQHFLRTGEQRRTRNSSSTRWTFYS